MTTTPSHCDSPEGAESSRPTVLVLGTAEWNAQIATNQHYVVRELARDFDTYFVESLGLRRVRLDAKDLTRIAGRVRRSVLGIQSTTAYRPVPERAKVISPLVVPIHHGPTRLPNRLLLERAVAEWRRSPRPRILWSFTPVTYDLERYADFTLYHCVDILQAFPGIDASAIATGEKKLAERAQLAIATSQNVEEHLTGVGFPQILTLPNVADVDVFTAASRPAAQRRPAAIFAGNLSPHKLNVDLLRALATAVQGSGELLLAGPVAAGGGGFDSELAELERLGARYLGVLTAEQLAEVAGTCTVGLIPYALNEYTAGVSPLKSYEYLAAGLEVVSTAIPDVIQAGKGTQFIHVAESIDGFVAKVLDRVGPVSDATIDARMDYAQGFSWKSRGELLRGIAAKTRSPRGADAEGPCDPGTIGQPRG